MKIGICDAEVLFTKRHRFPNLVCEKIAGYYIDKGHEVELIIDDQIDFLQYDKIFLSKVFTNTEVPKRLLNSPNVIKGGTGFYYDKAPKLPDEVEHHMPFYSLYDEWIEWEVISGKKESEFKCYRDYSIGFMTRGCFRGCEFCVNKNYKQVLQHSPLEEFLDKSRKKICLLDDNFLGCPNWKEMLLQLQETNKPFLFKQGLDERLLTKEKCDILFNSKYDGKFIFAFDNICDREIIEQKLKLIRETTEKRCMFYVLVGFDRNGKYDESFWKKDIYDMFERIKILFKYKCAPYLMRYETCYSSKWKTLYSTVATWCNQKGFYEKLTFHEFIEGTLNRVKNREMSSVSKMYLMVKQELPEVVKKYFDIRF